MAKQYFLLTWHQSKKAIDYRWLGVQNNLSQMQKVMWAELFHMWSASK